MGKKSIFALKKKDPVVSDENALSQIMLLLDRYNVDLEETEDEKQKVVLEEAARKTHKAVMAGWLEIYEEEQEIKVKQIIQHRSEKSTVSELIYGELIGEDNTAMPTGEKVNEYDRMYGLLGSMSKSAHGEAIVKKLKSSDLKIAMQLSFLFLAS